MTRRSSGGTKVDDTASSDPSGPVLERGPDQRKRRAPDGPAARTTPRVRARPLTDTERAAILAGHDEGLSRNGIARRVGRSPDTVTRVVTDAGRSFDRTATAAATEAAAVDRRAQRIAEGGRLLDIVGSTTDRLLGDRYLTPHEVAALARATVDVSNAHARLAEMDADRDGDTATAVGMMGRLYARLVESAGPYTGPTGVVPPAASDS